MGNKALLLLLTLLLLLLRLSLHCIHSTPLLLVFVFSIINVLPQDDLTFIILVYYHFHIMFIAIVIIADVILKHVYSQPAFACLKSTMETSEQCMKSVQR